MRNQRRQGVNILTYYMKKLTAMEPGRLEEIVIIAFFILFFIFTIVAESTSQALPETTKYQAHKRIQNMPVQ